jgi:hypothetical protein
MHKQRTQQPVFRALAGEMLEEVPASLDSLDTRFAMNDQAAASFIESIGRLPLSDSARAGEALLVICERDVPADSRRFNYTVIGDSSGTLYAQLLTTWPSDSDDDAEAFAQALTNTFHSL